MYLDLQKLGHIRRTVGTSSIEWYGGQCHEGDRRSPVPDPGVQDGVIHHPMVTEPNATAKAMSIVAPTWHRPSSSVENMACAL